MTGPSTRLPTILLCALCAAPSCLAGNLFDLGTIKPTRAVALVSSETASPATDPTSPMLAFLFGALHECSPEEVQRLRVCAAVAPRVAPPDDSVPVCVIRVSAGDQSADIEVVHDSGGDFFARALAAGDSRPWFRLKRKDFASLAADWPAYRGDFTLPPATPVGKVFNVPPPINPGWFVADDAGVADRFVHGRKSRIAGTTRKLEGEHFVMRLPANYDPRIASGLVVWIHAGPDGLIPQHLIPALDELGLIAIAAANTGNDRPQTDRYQLALDAVATASRRFLVDPARVYTTGISGGGKISSQLWLAYPDVFTGSVPFVQLCAYANVPAPGGKIYPGDIPKPYPAQMKLLMDHRIACMTGPKDFNYHFIKQAVALMESDKLPIRLFDYPDMGHEMPTPDRYADAFRWVDEDRKKSRDAQVAQAAKLLADLRADMAAASWDPPRLPQRVDAICAAAPWSAPAWDAVALLPQPVRPAPPRSPRP